jgi:hypothetical protein
VDVGGVENMLSFSNDPPKFGWICEISRMVASSQFDDF